MNGTANCSGRHGRPTRAVGTVGETSLCRKHLNRAQQDARIEGFIREEQPSCPDHPEAAVRVTRFDQSRPLLHCPRPTGEEIQYPAQGEGRVRTPAGATHTSWCNWGIDIPRSVLSGIPAQGPPRAHIELRPGPQEKLRKLGSTLAGRVPEGTLLSNRTMPGKHHITLRYLGNSTQCQLERMEAAAEDATRTTTLAKLELGTAPGSFPLTGHPGRRVIWVDVKGDTELLQTARLKLDEAAKEAGYQSAEWDFTPHITLGILTAPEEKMNEALEKWREIAAGAQGEGWSAGEARLITKERR